MEISKRERAGKKKTHIHTRTQEDTIIEKVVTTDGILFLARPNV